jgi:hypothetical protein
MVHPPGREPTRQMFHVSVADITARYAKPLLIRRSVRQIRRDRRLAEPRWNG